MNSKHLTEFLWNNDLSLWSYRRNSTKLNIMLFFTMFFFNRFSHKDYLRKVGKVIQVILYLIFLKHKNIDKKVFDIWYISYLLLKFIMKGSSILLSGSILLWISQIAQAEQKPTSVNKENICYSVWISGILNNEEVSVKICTERKTNTDEEIRAINACMPRHLDIKWNIAPEERIRLIMNTITTLFENYMKWREKKKNLFNFWLLFSKKSLQ